LRQIELLNHLGRLGLQPAGDLVVAPFRLDLILDSSRLRSRDA